MATINRAKRVQQKFIIRFRFYNDNSNHGNSFKWNIVTVRNLSSNGISFNYHRKIPLHTQVEFKMSLPFAEDFHCLGKVVRIDKEKHSETKFKKIPVYGVAVSFTKMDHFVKVAIHNFANEVNAE